MVKKFLLSVAGAATLTALLGSPAAHADGYVFNGPFYKNVLGKATSENNERGSRSKRRPYTRSNSDSDSSSVDTTGYFTHPLPGMVRRSRGIQSGHAGVDMAAPIGTPVLAAASGIVETVSYNDRGGKYVVVSHGGCRKTFYAHLSAYAVSEGHRVEQKQKLGEVGSTGNSTGPHLHFEVWCGSNNF